MIDDSLINPKTARMRANRPIRYAWSLVLALLIITAYFAYRTWANPQPAVGPARRTLVSAAELEERYGIQLRLIGVTGGGGLIDFRLKIIDAAKAEQILGNPERPISLLVAGSGTVLSVLSPASQDADAQLADDKVFVALVPNSGSIVKPGTTVVVTFGDLELEPVLAQ